MIIKPEIFSHKAIKSIQTTRLGGHSSKPYDTMNLGVFGKDESAQANLLTLTKEQKLPHTPVFMQQTHTDKVVEYGDSAQEHGLIQADACFTRKANIICTVLTADCLPVLISDKNASIVAAIHCGWRGLYANILKKCIAKMGVNGKDLLCWLGPCISYKPYRVDENFRKQFVLQNKELAHCFYRDRRGSWHADLKKIARIQLQQLGVGNISQSPYCTHDNKNLFYSYRRDTETGRMASMIWIDED